MASTNQKGSPRKVDSLDLKLEDVLNDAKFVESHSLSSRDESQIQTQRFYSNRDQTAFIVLETCRLPNNLTPHIERITGYGTRGDLTVIEQLTDLYREESVSYAEET